ncbi:MAG: hypothetical protein BRC25_03625 [Parcubacteria group bacterium SW_6_46_9]|nr:MAG: hypothetical protein BRC25_03625 [Parcubacteria group bacterium SW_6_46_9]
MDQTISKAELQKAGTLIEDTYAEMRLLFGDRLFDAMDELSDLEIAAYMHMFQPEKGSYWTTEKIIESLNEKYDSSIEDKDDWWEICNRASKKLSDVLGIEPETVNRLTEALDELEDAKIKTPSA